MTYKNLLKLNKVQARMILIKKLKKNNGDVKKTARQFKTDPKVVRKWRNRYEKDGEEGLKDKPPIPKKYQTNGKSLQDRLLIEERKKKNKLWKNKPSKTNVSKMEYEFK